MKSNALEQKHGTATTKHKAVSSRQESEKRIDADIYARLVEKKAYELFEKRGCQLGHDWDDWLEAERIVEAELIAGQIP